MAKQLVGPGDALLDKIADVLGVPKEAKIWSLHVDVNEMPYLEVTQYISEGEEEVPQTTRFHLAEIDEEEIGPSIEDIARIEKPISRMEDPNDIMNQEPNEEEQERHNEGIGESDE